MDSQPNVMAVFLKCLDKYAKLLDFHYIQQVYKYC